MLIGLGALNAIAATPKWDAVTLNDQGMLHEWLDMDPTSAIQKIARRVC
jgi:hypothetical protein